MQTYVNEKGDVYLSSRPRHALDVPVSPRPHPQAIFDFEKGDWCLPAAPLFGMLKRLRAALLDTSLLQIPLAGGVFTFPGAVKDIQSVYEKMNWMAGGDSLLQWKTEDKTAEGAAVFVSLNFADLQLVHEKLQAFSQTCFDLESATTDAARQFLNGTLPAAGLVEFIRKHINALGISLTAEVADVLGEIGGLIESMGQFHEVYLTESQR